MGNQKGSILAQVLGAGEDIDCMKLGSLTFEDSQFDWLYK